MWRGSPPPDDVLLQQLLDDVDDVGHVDFVDQAVDGLLQGLPAHPLIGQAAQDHNNDVTSEKNTQSRLPVPRLGSRAEANPEL